MPSFSANAPVISVGNLTVGGVGKTPFTMYLAEQLREMGYRPAILLRGYKRTSVDPILLQPDQFSFQKIPHYGDEAALISFTLQLPVGIGANRKQVADLLLSQTDCNILLLDDGFQHLRLRRDLNLVILDGEKPFGNGRCIPYGPLREPISALQDAHAILVRANNDFTGWNKADSVCSYHVPTIPSFVGNFKWEQIIPFRAWVERDVVRDVPLDQFPFREVHLLSGIGNPNRFHHQAEQTGFHVREHFRFPDHHWYTRDELAAISAQSHEDPILTTEKDAIRLLPLLERDPALIDTPIHIIQGRWRMQEENRFMQWLESRLGEWSVSG